MKTPTKSTIAALLSALEEACSAGPRGRRNALQSVQGKFRAEGVPAEHWLWVKLDAAAELLLRGEW